MGENSTDRWIVKAIKIISPTDDVWTWVSTADGKSITEDFDKIHAFTTTEAAEKARTAVIKTFGYDVLHDVALERTSVEELET